MVVRGYWSSSGNCTDCKRNGNTYCCHSNHTISFRGLERINQAIEGINLFKDHVDSLLVINNEKLREIYGNLKVSNAFDKADDVLSIAAKGIAEIITVHGYINVDFADVETVMSNSGVAIMGSATASGENRAETAIAAARTSPLLNNNDITGARSVLLNITSGTEEITMDEISQITDYVVSATSRDTTLIWGMGNDQSPGDHISVTIIATGFKMNSIPELYIGKKQKHMVPREIPGREQYRGSKIPRWYRAKYPLSSGSGTVVPRRSISSWTSHRISHRRAGQTDGRPGQETEGDP